jgi:hypothetical protein
MTTLTSQLEEAQARAEAAAAAAASDEQKKILENNRILKKNNDILRKKVEVRFCGGDSLRQNGPVVASKVVQNCPSCLLYDELWGVEVGSDASLLIIAKKRHATSGHICYET